MWLVIFFIFLNVSLVSAMDMEVRSVKKHTKDDLSIFLERRVIDVHSERDAEEMGQRPRFVGTVFNASTRSRELRENSAFEDARWGLLDGGVNTTNEWTHIETMGDVTPASTVQFLIATDGSGESQTAIASVLKQTGGGIVGAVSFGSFVAVGGPTTAVSVERVRGVLWIGPLTPADRTARAWDAILSRVESLNTFVEVKTFLEASKIAVDADDRATIEVVLPPLVTPSFVQR
jgi:hypothetical protein